MFAVFADYSTAKFDKRIKPKELNLTAAVPLLGFNNTDFFISPKNLFVDRVLTRDFLQSRLNITLVTPSQAGSMDMDSLLDAFLESKIIMDSLDTDVFFDFFDSPSMVFLKNIYDVHVNIIKNDDFIRSIEEEQAAESESFFTDEQLDNFNTLFDGLNLTEDSITSFLDNKNSSALALDEEVESFITFLQDFESNNTFLLDDDEACERCLGALSAFRANQATAQVVEKKPRPREQKPARLNFFILRQRKKTNDCAAFLLPNEKIKKGYCPAFYPIQRFLYKPSCRNRK
jgi:hypothetical protein